MKSKISDLILDLRRKYPEDSKEQLIRRLTAMAKDNPELTESLVDYVLMPRYAEDMLEGKEPLFRKPN